MNCTKCEACLMGRGSLDAKYIFIVDTPSQQDMFYKSILSGAQTDFIDKTLKDVDINPNDCYFTSIVKKFVSDKKDPSKVEIENCKECFEAELDNLQSKQIIILLGSFPLKIILKKTRITKHRGALEYSNRFKCNIFPIINPLALLRDVNQKHIIYEDLRKLKQICEGTVEEQIPVKYIWIDTINLFNDTIKRLNEVAAWSFDIETTDVDPLNNRIIAINFSWKERTGVVIPLLKQKDLSVSSDVSPELFWGDNQQYIIDKLKEIFKNNAIKIAHNLLFDSKFLRYHGFTINNAKFDTMIAHHLLDENAVGMHDLKSLASLYTDMGNYEKGRDDFFVEHPSVKDQFIYLPQDLFFKYGASDADCTFRLYNIFKPKLTEGGFDKLFYNILMPLTKTLGDAELNGMSFDMEYSKKLKEEMGKEVEDALNKIHSHIGELNLYPKAEYKPVVLASYIKTARIYKNNGDYYNLVNDNYIKIDKPEIIIKPGEKIIIYEYISSKVNINSPKQLRELLYTKLKLPVLKKTDHDNDSTDKDVLEELSKINPIAKDIVNYRKISKLFSTYVVGMAERVSNVDGKNHPYFLIHGTVTGRLSSNMQQMPRDDKRIKKQFIASPGCKLVEADFKAAEFRLLIEYSHDEQLLKDIKKGLDTHKLVAALTQGVHIPEDVSLEEFKILVKDITKLQRQQAKVTAFSVIYGRSSKNVAEELGISEYEAQKILRALFGRYKKAKQWIDDTIKNLPVNKCAKSVFGRVRRLPNINSSDKGLRNEAIRQCINAPLSSTASDLNCFASTRIVDKFKALNLKGKLILLVHDSQLYDIPDSDVEQSVKLIKEEMERPVGGLITPMEAEFKIGVRWGELEEIKA